MTYVDVVWQHDHPNDPIRLVSELDSSRNETRKLEFFRDNRVGFASALGHTSGTALGEAPVPEIEEINRDKQFTAKVMSADEFKELWAIHVEDLRALSSYKIVETFEISGRGVVVIITETVDLGVGKKLAATIRRPDGTSFDAIAMQEWLLRRTVTAVEHAAFLLADVPKRNVPLGSTINFGEAKL